MSTVRWQDEDLPIRVFQIALRLSAHFLERLEQFQPDPDSELRPIDVLSVIDQDLQLAYKQLGDKPLPAYYDHLRSRLEVSGSPDGYRDVIGAIAADLDGPFVSAERLAELNRRAFDTLGKCIGAWGGPAAAKRARQLKLLPVCCETPFEDSPLLSFVRRENSQSLLLRAGPVKDVLWECIILEFSFFHEYLSHCFPSWDEDHEEVSEGYLFAVEWDWFQNQYLPFDIELLRHQWSARLEANRPWFHFALWLLRRECSSAHHCSARFLLEWAARWEHFAEPLHADLASQLSGVARKIMSRMGRFRPKDTELLKTLEQVICGECHGRAWSLKNVSKELAKALDAFTLPA